MDRLASAESNDPKAGTAADVYRRAVLWRPVTPARIAACAMLLTAMGDERTLPGYTCTVNRRGLVADVTVVEEATGATETLAAVLPEGQGGRCRVGEVTYGVADLFLIQRGRVLERLAEDAVAAVRTARRSAIERVERLIDPLRIREAAIPEALATLLGYEEGERMVTEIEQGASLAHLPRRVAMLRARGVEVPTAAVARALAERLAGALLRLPAETSTALEVLDVAEAIGVQLDLVAAQVSFVRWRDSAAAGSADESVDRLRQRLGVSALADLAQR
jgi:hypothetical protein